MRTEGLQSRRALTLATICLTLLFQLSSYDVMRAEAATLPCTTICTGTSGACSVSGTITITPGSTIDCTGRQVTIQSLATLKVEDGDMKLIASTLTVASSGVIKAVEVTGNGSLGLDIEMSGAISIYGSLQADGASGGGTINVDAGGAVTIVNDGDKGIEASGTTGGADGGDIEVTSGGTINIQNPVRAESATSGEVVGGRVALRATTDVVVTSSSGKILVNGHQMDGGRIDIDAGHDITVSSSAKLEANGRDVGGNGGGVYLVAGNRVDLASTVSARGGVGVGGGASTGGSLQIESGCGGARVAATVDVRGGENGGGTDGGALEIETRGDLTVEASILIDTHSVGNGGAGGDVRLAAGKKLDIKSNVLIDVRGDTGDPDGDGRAGNVALEGCQIETGSGTKIDARGLAGGIITLDSASTAGPQVTSLHINGTSVFDTTSTVTAVDDGSIRVAVANESVTGSCSQAPYGPCTLDANCTVGCTPGNCNGLNPDTDNTLNQFVTTPDLIEDENLTGCSKDCTP